MCPAFLTVSSVPAVVWWLPDYIPPAQKSSYNKLAFGRAGQVRALKERAHFEVLPEGIDKTSCPKEKRIVVVENYKEGRLYDKDNFAQACKALRDSLVPWAIYDDTPKACEFYYSQYLAKQVKLPVGTLVSVWRIVSCGERIRGFEFN